MYTHHGSHPGYTYRDPRAGAGARAFPLRLRSHRRLRHALVAYDSRHNTDQLTQTSSPPAAISSSCNPHAVVASPGITRHGITTRPEGTLATSHACVPHRHCTERSPFERWSTNCSPPCTSFGLPTPRPTAWFERSHHLLLRHHLASSAIASSAIRLLHHD